MHLSEWIDVHATGIKVVAATALFGAGVVAGYRYANCENFGKYDEDPTQGCTISSDASIATKECQHHYKGMGNKDDTTDIIHELDLTKASLKALQKQYDDVSRSFEKRFADMKNLREMERKGRTQAEMALRRKVKEWCDDHGHLFHAVGTAETPFPDRRGTPRHGRLAPSTRGMIRLHRTLREGLEGLDGYTHLWIVFVFNDNTDASKRVLGPIKAHGQKTNSGRGGVCLVNFDNDEGVCESTIQESSHRQRRASDSGVTSDKYWSSTKAHVRVAPPALLGKRIGVYATRSPHHPNPIGLTLVKIEGVDVENGTVSVSGIDLLNGTPVLDIKPYLPPFDRMDTAASPAWLVNSFNLLLPVHFTPAAERGLADAVQQGCFYLHAPIPNGVDGPPKSMGSNDHVGAAHAGVGVDVGADGVLAEARRALEEVLRLDIRSVWTGRGSGWTEPDAASCHRVEGNPPQRVPDTKEDSLQRVPEPLRSVSALQVTAASSAAGDMAATRKVKREMAGDARAPPPATAVWELHYCKAHITFKTLADGVHVLTVTPSTA
eukprot:m.37720 g.37720  ORF g.37720 m.37720 type:complete len:549 (+) comp14585_c1_seq7:212-1858(+)